MIEFNNVVKSFGKKRVLTGLTFTARDGAVTGFVGPNGAGKSTAFKTLFGLLRADSGTALVDGRRSHDIGASGRTWGAFLGGSQIPPSMSGRGYLNYTADLCRVSREDIDDCLAAVNLQARAHTAVGSYSLGMRQRLGLAAALIGRPRNLILDEPVNGLDIEGVHWLRGHLRQAAADGRCILLSSHLLSELELIADDVVMLTDGRASRAGSLDSLRVADEDHVLVSSSDDARLATLLEAQGLRISISEHGVSVAGMSVNQVAALAGALDVPLLSVGRELRRLEDVYLDQVRAEGPQR